MHARHVESPSEMTDRFLKRAIHLARQAAGGVAPRPPVGAVVVKDGTIVGEGRTRPRPGRHAEAEALMQAGEAARGATLVCTLEPHGFQGVSPPCTDAIIEAGIVCVECPVEDPNPAVSGKGYAQLRSAGVEVVTASSDELQRDALALIEGYARHMSTGLPLVTAKFAMSLDGKIATHTGDSQWITGELARQTAHQMRAESEAVVVGAGTVFKDNPRLTARDERGGDTGRPALRVLVDTNGRIPPASRVFAESGKVIWAVADGAGVTPPGPNVEVVQLPTRNGLVDLRQLIAYLGKQDVHNALFEGGGSMLGTLFDEGLVDKVAAFTAPVIVGGRGAMTPVSGEGVSSIVEALRLIDVRRTQLGPDILTTGYVPKNT